MNRSLEEMDAHIEDLQYQMAHAHHRRRELVLQHLGQWREGAPVNELWGTLFAFLELKSREKRIARRAFGLGFNVCLVYASFRPAFMLQSVDYKTPEEKSLYELTKEFIVRLGSERKDGQDSIFVIVKCPMGEVVCLRSKADGVRQQLEYGKTSNRFDTAMGKVIGYPFPSELAEIGQHSERYMVLLKVHQILRQEGHTSEPSAFMCMVATNEHSIGALMNEALRYRDAAGHICPSLRVSFEVVMMSQTHGDPDGPAAFRSQGVHAICTHVSSTEAICNQAQAPADHHNCKTIEHTHGEGDCKHIPVQHAGHTGYIVGDELHCPDANANCVVHATFRRTEDTASVA
jgi:hypothetical protein